MTAQAPLDIKIISAGAGSGKTYSLTGQMVEMLRAGVRPSGIVATTFTQKAAAELQERVRVRLLESGLADEAAELGQALIGTVHSLGVKLLQRFAFEAGVSPLVEIMAEEDGQIMFNQSLAQSLAPEKIDRLHALAEHLGLSKKKGGTAAEEPYDWRRDVRSITEAARANDFSIDVLDKSRRLSFESLAELFGKKDNQLPSFSPDFDWNGHLRSLLKQSIAAIEANENDTTKTTSEAALVFKNALNQLDHQGGLPWHEWAKLSKTAPGAKSRDLCAELRAFARRHDECPAFHSDVRAFIDLVFETAMGGLHEFAEHKRRRGLIDYTDMEALVNRLLDEPTVQSALREELDLLLVDEFQDTSPIQLSIFLKLSRLAKHSIWVGDPKQSIYGFRGAEPRLMQAIVEATGGIRPENILPDSWRSVPDLVAASNAIFCKAFKELPPAQIALSARRAAVEQPDSAPFRYEPIVHWRFLSEADERKTPGKPWTEHCIAASIAALIERGPLILPKGEKKPRPARAGDVAVLCRSNRDCAVMAEALHRAGLKASLARAGLLSTDEARLVLACLKFVLSSHDALAAAELLKFAEHWDLEKIIADRLDFLQKQGFDEPAPLESKQKILVGRWASEAPIVRRLNELRPLTAELSASETLNFLLDELDLRRTAARWGSADQRLDNIDRLRKLASQYEENCARLHAAASLGGFLLWLDGLERSGADLQGSGEGPDAVRAMTYHKSKGLEFPIVVLHSLEGALRESIWGLSLVADRAETDLGDILGGRWLRFWPNPYADQIGGTQLEENLEASPVFEEAKRQALAEEARLFYVGLTRARDFLIFPTTAKPAKWLNRVFCDGRDDHPVLDADQTETPFEWKGRFVPKTTETIYFGRDFGEKEIDEPALRFAAEPSGKRFFSPLKIDPQADLKPDEALSLGGAAFWFSPLALKKSPDEPSGLMAAINGVFLADRPTLSDAERIETATELLKKNETEELVSAEAVLRQSGAFFSFFGAFDAKTQVRRAVPIRSYFDGRLFESQADLIFEKPNEALVFQFGQWTDGGKASKKSASELAPLLTFIKKSLERRWPDKAVRAFALLAVDGAAVETVDR